VVEVAMEMGTRGEHERGGSAAGKVREEPVENIDVKAILLW